MKIKNFALFFFPCLVLFLFYTNGLADQKESFKNKPPKPVNPIYKPGDGRPNKPPYKRPRTGRNYSSEKETIIIIEKTVEVPGKEKTMEKDKTWVPPVYESVTIPGHWTSGVKEERVEGVRSFSDDDTQRVWIPEKTIKVEIRPGYYTE